ncbi:MAG: M20/M25/M40 family metallo-hydrolase [Thermoguttaceae bacterium]
MTTRLVAAMLLWASWLATMPALAADRSSALQAALESITPEALGRSVRDLAGPKFEGREAGSVGGRAAGDYLAAELAAIHLQGAAAEHGFFQPLPPGLRNVLGALPGSDPVLKDYVLVIGAHYDHLGHGVAGSRMSPPGAIYPGADDNASGSAGVLQVARALAQLPRPPKRSVLLAFWDGEEKGMLGSKYWTDHPTRPLDHVAAMLNLDMIGTLRDNRLTVFGSRTGYGFRRLLCEENQPDGLLLDFSWPMIPNADHYSFFQHGIPVLFLHTGLHERYHRPSDTADKVDAAGMMRVARLALLVTCELADRPGAARFRATARTDNDEGRRRLAQADPSPVRPGDPPLRLGIAWRLDEAEPGTIVVSHVVTGSPAASAGLQVGDRVYQIGGRDFPDDTAFARLAKELPGPIELLVERDGRLRVVMIRLEAAAPAIKRAA